MDLLYQFVIAPIEAVMRFVLSASYSAVGSYGVAILILSFLINVGLLPLFHIAEKWQEAERRVQRILKPKLDEFREAFAGEERHVMIHTLYRQTGYHPIYAMRSSVGLFLQLPFWIAAYQLLSQYQPLYGASFLMFEDLGQPDQLLGGFNLLPFMMTAVNLAAAFVYTKGLSRMEQIQPIALAAVFLLLLYGAPAGLLLYWTFNSLFSLLRIALFTPTRTSAPASAGAEGASLQATLFRHRPVVGDTDGKGSTRGKSHDQVVLTHESGRQGPRLVNRAMMINIALFGVVVVAQTSMHLDRFWDQKTILLQNSWIPWMLAAGSIAILVYLCAAFSLTTTRESTKQNPRQLLNVALVWLLCAVLAIVDIAWLFHAYPDLHPARLIGGILLLLAVVFGSPFSDNIPITTNMPTDHALYAVSMSLIAFVVFLANPIGLYVSSSDFIGGVYNLAGTLLMFALIAVLGATALYLLLDTAARKILTLLIVFLAVIIVGYSALGVKGAGIMSQFILPLPNGLLRTGREIALESTILLLIFGVTSYATVRHRQNVTYAVAAMLAASLCLTVTDLYLAKGDKFVASKELPEDHADIVSFSTERNILVLMLDGFPGGYLHRIMEEVPEILREYDGFTWFPNTVTTNADTLGAIATLAGGPRYKPDKINSRNYDSVGSAIHESYGVYIDAFMPKGYQITYVNPTFAGGCDTFRKEIHCSETFPYGVYYHNKEEPDVPLLQGDSHVPWIMAMVSVLQAAPFFLKSWLYDNGGYHGANPTVVRQTAANSLKVREWGFLRVLSRESSAHSRSKTLKFIQLSIPHPPNALDAHCKMEPGQSTVFTEAVCALKEIGTLLLRLQETGIYDVTKIVVVSDHGWYVDNPLFPRDFEKTVPKWQGWLSIPGIAHPLLMVKDFGMRGTFRRSNTFLSNSDVPSLVCSAIEACRDVEPDPTKTNTSERTLTFSIIRYPPEEVQAKKFDIVTTFEVRNNIFDPQNWKRVN